MAARRRRSWPRMGAGALALLTLATACGGGGGGEQVTQGTATASTETTAAASLCVPRQSANCEGLDLDGVDLSGADLEYAILAYSSLHGADLHGADLSGATINDAVLTSANLRGAKLSGAFMDGTDLTDADLTGAVIDRVSLRKANVARATFTDVTFATPPLLTDVTDIDDTALIAIFKVGVNDLARTLSENQVELQSRDSYKAKIAAVCAGTPDADAGTALPDRSFLPMLQVTNEDVTDDGERREFIPMMAGAAAERYTALVVCVDAPTYDVIGTCGYHGRGNVDVRIEHLPVRVLDARTGDVVATATFDGDYGPASCPMYIFSDDDLTRRAPTEVVQDFLAPLVTGGA